VPTRNGASVQKDGDGRKGLMPCTTAGETVAALFELFCGLSQFGRQMSVLWNGSFILLFLSQSALIENGGPMIIIRCMDKPAHEPKGGSYRAVNMADILKGDMP
jgi:hypothetical protein